MAKTRDQLIESVLLRLKVLASGQSPAAEDQETVGTRIDPILAEASARGLVNIPDSEAIPDALFMAVTDLVALWCSPDFSGSAAELAADGVSEATVNNRLRILTTAMPAEDDPSAPAYF